jgi:hypothetical protein
MAKIKSLYKDYFQKSRIFLYPLLEIKKGTSVTPIETYMAWADNHAIHDAKLCCLYYLRKDLEFTNFERTKLLNNKYFHDFKEVGNDQGIYIFDFSAHQDDWNHILNGKYSKLSNSHKTKIRNYIGLNNDNIAYIDSFLYPERYFKLYAEMILVKESLLREVGELCSLPDLDKETLKVVSNKFNIVE